MAPKFPFLASLPTALDKHNHSLEARAERAHRRIAAQDKRAGRVDERLTQHLDAVDGVLASNDEYLDSIEEAIGDNGGPTLGEDTQTSPGDSGKLVDSPKQPESPGLPKAPQIAPAPTPSPAQGVRADGPFRT